MECMAGLSVFLRGYYSARTTVIDPKQGPLYHPGRGPEHGKSPKDSFNALDKSQLPIQVALAKAVVLKLVK